ncbi:MAG: hypothetical protein JXR38_00095 [Bacilli bacterium]|nr:hypothetical protein [Bacilli bacterium]
MTSIGMDGEPFDNVTSLPKPRIHVRPGFLVATADMCLEAFEARFEEIETTDVSTPLGNIVIVRIVESGNALVAGPSDVKSMEKVIEKIKRLGAKKIFIDGAFSRHSTAKVTEATILCIGANRSPIMETVIKDAKVIVEKLTLPSVDNDLRFLDDVDKATIIQKNKDRRMLSATSAISEAETILAEIDANSEYLYLPNAITGDFLRRFQKEKRFGEIGLIVSSPVNLILNDNDQTIFEHMKSRISVLRPVKLAAVCINPYSPAGYRFSTVEFRKQLEACIKYPVIDVLEGKDNLL